jgi:hypothetical protein
MREDMSDDAGLASPAHNGLERRRLFERCRVILRGAPFRRRHSTQETFPRNAPDFFGALRGKVSCVESARAAQSPVSGHSTQAGFFGVQIDAPRSIRACALSPARDAASPAPEHPISVAANFWMRGLAFGGGSSTANSRDTTRSILPSTGMVRRSKAIAAIAAAV